MTDMSQTIIAKSDQMNSDDLIGRSITIKITKVSLLAGDQPIAVNYEGDNGKPFKPCKTVRRIMVGVWGSDGNEYIGRSMTLHRDSSVTFGGMAVGGIRVSHMSHINEPVTLALAVTKGKKKAVTIQPLRAAEAEEHAQKKPVTPATGPKIIGSDGRELFLPDFPAWIEKITSIVSGFSSITQLAEFDKRHTPLLSAYNDAGNGEFVKVVRGIFAAAAERLNQPPASEEMKF